MGSFFVLFMCIVLCLGKWELGRGESGKSLPQFLYIFTPSHLFVCDLIAVAAAAVATGNIYIWFSNGGTATGKALKIVWERRKIFSMFQRIWPELNFQSFSLLFVCVFTPISIYFNDLTFFLHCLEWAISSKQTTCSWMNDLFFSVIVCISIRLVRHFSQYLMSPLHPIVIYV